LASRAGEVVEKRELLAQVWPAVVVDEGSLRFHMNGLRKALGDGKDGARYISTIPGRGYCFVAPIVRLEGPGLPIGQPGRADARVNLPSRLSRMIGREQTVHEVAECLLAKNFVTLLGPGGIGKTTMAISIGHQLLPAVRRQRPLCRPGGNLRSPSGAQHGCLGYRFRRAHR
jgi:hypothetical protein